MSGKLFNTCSHGWLLDLGALGHLSGMLKDLFDISKAKSNLFTKKILKQINQNKIMLGLSQDSMHKINVL